MDMGMDMMMGMKMGMKLGIEKNLITTSAEDLLNLVCSFHLVFSSEFIDFWVSLDWNSGVCEPRGEPL